MHDEVHWLEVIVHQCLNGRTPPYLSEHCIPVYSADTRRHLRSANRHLLAVRVSGSTLTAVGSFQLLARWSGTLYLLDIILFFYPRSNE